VHSFFEWWGGLSPWLRFGVAGGFLLLSTLIWLLADRIWIWGWVIGIVLLIFSFPSGPEKKGYHDF
jgi:hypothetical protein